MSYINDFKKIEMPDSLRAFTISAFRMITKNPKLALYIAQEYKDEEHISNWEKLYNDLKEPEFSAQFSRNIELSAKCFDWTNVEASFCIWGKYGWVTDGQLMSVDLWSECPSSQVEADKFVLSRMKKLYILEMYAEVEQLTANKKVFDEACDCFDSKLYTACASLLLSLIDGALIRAQEGKHENKKTGASAEKRVAEEVSKDSAYSLPGYFHLELLNYNAFIQTLFESGNGFKKEPKHLNRNYLHHGMNKRKVLKKDCIKLFVAYRQTLRLTSKNA